MAMYRSSEPLPEDEAPSIHTGASSGADAEEPEAGDAPLETGPRSQKGAQETALRPEGSPSEGGVKKHPFFLSVPRNLEGLALDELRELGIPGGEAKGLGIDIALSQEEAYRIVYNSRLVSRVLRPLTLFPCPTVEALYQKARSMRWTRLLGPDKTFSITASVRDSNITHSQYATLTLKDAMVDSIRDETGARPSVDRDRPDLRFDLHLHGNLATLSLYYSDGAMFRRGYRTNSVEAPLKENLAAGILRFARYTPDTPLVDFFCGSGTFLIEAAFMATATPAGYLRRKQGFEKNPDFNPALWDKVKKESDAKIIPLRQGLIKGYDRDGYAIEAAKDNLSRTPFWGKVVFVRKAFEDIHASGDRFEKTLVVSNPPYGKRLGEEEEMPGFYEALGRFFRERFSESRAVLMMPRDEDEKHLGIKGKKRLRVDNGDMEVRVNEYALGMKD